jgi:UDP-3-O-[3-hydroxymyristoyl] glucosamine N-acyltransferase
MKFTAIQIASMINGEIEGDPNVLIGSVSKIEEGTPGTLTFLANPKYTEYIYTTQASVVIVNKSFIPEKPIRATLIKVDDAYASFAKLLETYSQINLNKVGIEQPTSIAETATIGQNAYIGAFTYIGNYVKIGNNVKIYPNCYIGDHAVINDNTTLFANVTIYTQCIIGNNCTIHSGAVIGADGFGFAPNSQNSYQKVPQIGNVLIEDFVEIGANTTIDRATIGSTIIRKGVKIDNMVQIAHNVEVGQNTVIAAQTGIAGSTKIGKNCMIGGQVGIVGHISIANGVKIAAQSGIGQSITKENEIVQGSPAYGIGDYKRSYVLFKKLPELQQQLTLLEKEISQLKKCI